MKRLFGLAIEKKIVYFRGKGEILRRIASPICVGKPCTVKWQFLHDFYSVYSDEAMKR
jgi:hypothetical protein